MNTSLGTLPPPAVTPELARAVQSALRALEAVEEAGPIPYGLLKAVADARASVEGAARRTNVIR